MRVAARQRRRVALAAAVATLFAAGGTRGSANDIGPDSPTRPVQLSKIIVKLDRGQPYGKMKSDCCVSAAGGWHGTPGGMSSTSMI